MTSQVVEWLGSRCTLVRLGARYPSAGPLHRPAGVVVEQGHYLAATGVAAIPELLDHELGPALVKRHRDGTPVQLRTERGDVPFVTGGGMGQAALAEHFVVPGRPELHDGRVVAYRLLGDDQAAQTRWGSEGCAVVRVLDLLRSRHTAGGRAAPDGTVWAAVEDLVHNYLAPRYGCRVLGGFDCGDPASPGDWAEHSMRVRRKGRAHEPPPDDALACYSAALEALAKLGFEHGQTSWGPGARAALAAFQVVAGLPADGVLSHTTAEALRAAKPPG